MSFPFSLATFTIANGANTSNQVFIGDSELVGLLMDPSAWTTAKISFLVSLDGTNFYPMYDGMGELIQLGVTTALAAATYIAIGEETNVKFEHFRGVQWLQLQSGVPGTTVNQGGARALTGVLRSSRAGSF